MNDIPAELDTAITCAKIAAGLYERPWFIDLSKDGVHVTDTFFHHTFDDWYAEDCLDDHEYHRHDMGGVTVYCIVPKEEDDGRA